MRGEKSSILLQLIQMENERVNRSNNGYKGKRTEGGYKGQQKRNANGGAKESTGYKKGQKFYSNKDKGEAKPYFNKRSQNTNGGYNPYKDTDDDYGKKHEVKRKAPTSKDKIKDIQPDKADIAKRFEKEKKVMQKKKQDSKKNHQTQRPQMKAKRTNNIDWTREYENDSYDDDDMSYYY